MNFVDLERSDVIGESFFFVLEKLTLLKKSEEICALCCLEGH